MRRKILLACGVLSLVLQSVSLMAADEPLPSQRRERALEFHRRGQERTGVLIPMYVYPANIHTNAAYNRLMNLKRHYETVPFWVIVNPASGRERKSMRTTPRQSIGLQGAGCLVLGYVTTSYGKRSVAEVRSEIGVWTKLYPRTQGIFFDEMIYEDTEAAVKPKWSSMESLAIKAIGRRLPIPAQILPAGILPPMRPT